MRSLAKRKFLLSLPQPGRNGAWQQRGHRSRGRRCIPKDVVLRMWAEGKSSRQISDALGVVRGAKFTTSAIERVIWAARIRGDAVPFHRVTFEDFYDSGISLEQQRALGL